MQGKIHRRQTLVERAARETHGAGFGESKPAPCMSAGRMPAGRLSGYWSPSHDARLSTVGTTRPIVAGMSELSRVPCQTTQLLFGLTPNVARAAHPVRVAAVIVTATSRSQMKGSSVEGSLV